MSELQGVHARRMSKSAWVALLAGAVLLILGLARGLMSVGPGCGVPFLPFDLAGPDEVVRTIVESCSGARSQGTALAWSGIVAGLILIAVGVVLLVRRGSGVRPSGESA